MHKYKQKDGVGTKIVDSRVLCKVIRNFHSKIGRLQGFKSGLVKTGKNYWLVENKNWLKI